MSRIIDRNSGLYGTVHPFYDIRVLSSYTCTLESKNNVKQLKHSLFIADNVRFERPDAVLTHKAIKGRLMATLRPEPKLPDEIIEAAKAGNLVLFIGAGISRMVGHPSWDGFADAVVNQLVKNEVIDHHEKSLINALPDPRKRLSIAKILDEDNGAKIDYKKIFELSNPWCNVYDFINKYNCTFVTTNYDKLIKPTISQSKPETSWRYFKRIDLLNAKLDTKGAVIHLHGCVDDPSSMIVTTKDYLEHYVSDEVPKFLTHLFSSKVVLFLGYGLEETEILEYVLKSSDQKEESEKRLFILQGFFNAEEPLFNKLKAYYEQSFNAQLIVFPRDHEDYAQQQAIIKKWGSELEFKDLALADKLAALEADLDE
ncbi:hypothetical protein EK599_04200 [Vibrio sp. T187]|nr:hypothetical protein [Vibrio sp. T187]